MSVPIYGANRYGHRSTDCSQEFTFGQDGKPFFVSGPYDSPARCEQIIRTLHERCGPGGYHFIVPADDQAALPWLSHEPDKLGTEAG